MSFQSLVKSTVLIGSSSAATTLVGILRVKALALLVGPAGVGLLGVLAGVAGVGTTLSALGADTSGTRRIALDRGDADRLARVRRTLLLVALVHGIACAALFWLLRVPLARLVLGSEEHAFDVGLVGLAVALSLVAGLQIAQLQGLGRVRDIARVNVLASLTGSALGLAAVAMWGKAGLVLLVVAQPAVAAVLASRAAAVPHTLPRPAIGWRGAVADWREMVGAGVPYMLSFLVLAVVPLAIRALVIHDLGIEAAGHFHAAWTMAVTYVGFLLNAMSADYFPRLTAIARDREAAAALIDDQIQLGLAIGGVALLAMLAGAPLLVPLLYSDAFSPAITLVEWMALGNVMKVAGWPIAFLAMAHGRSLQFFLLELAWSLVLLALVVLLLPHAGLAATGIAFTVACAVFLGLQAGMAYAAFGFRPTRNAVAMLACFLAAGATTLLAARLSPLLAAGLGGSLALILGLTSLRFILGRIGADGRIAALAWRGFERIGWPMPAALAHRQG
ncbi:MAG: oligosaccharide flippase family protein [Hyphomicrobiaceae bacterium]